jgi:hypothetical protein
MRKVMGSEKANGDYGGLYPASIKVWGTVQSGTGVGIINPLTNHTRPLKNQAKCCFRRFCAYLNARTV